MKVSTLSRARHMSSMKPQHSWARPTEHVKKSPRSSPTSLLYFHFHTLDSVSQQLICLLASHRDFLSFILGRTEVSVEFPACLLPLTVKPLRSNFIVQVEHEQGDNFNTKPTVGRAERG